MTSRGSVPQSGKTMNVERRWARCKIVRAARWPESLCSAGVQERCCFHTRFIFRSRSLTHVCVAPTCSALCRRATLKTFRRARLVPDHTHRLLWQSSNYSFSIHWDRGRRTQRFYSYTHSTPITLAIIQLLLIHLVSIWTDATYFLLLLTQHTLLHLQRESFTTRSGVNLGSKVTKK
jgi:hypothetical protein